MSSCRVLGRPAPSHPAPSHPAPAQTDLHLAALGRRNLGVVHADLAFGHLVQALLDDAQRLPHLLAADEVAVVAVTALAHGHVKVDLGSGAGERQGSDGRRGTRCRGKKEQRTTPGQALSPHATPCPGAHLVVGVVGLRFAEVPGNARAAQHHARKAVVQCLLGGHDANVNQALLPQAAARQKLLDLEGGGEYRGGRTRDDAQRGRENEGAQTKGPPSQCLTSSTRALKWLAKWKMSSIRPAGRAKKRRV